MAHPLDPLDTNELERAVAIARDVLGLGEGVRFIEVGLDEPEKAAVLAWREGGPAPPRQATLTLLDNATGEAEVAVVSLDAGEVVSRTPIADSQPAMSIDEFVEGGEAVKADPGYRAALARRGIGDDQLELVHVEPWTVGDFEGAERRLARAISWLRSSADDPNPYARPIGGLLAIVDLNTMQVVRIDDHGPLPLPEQAWTYRNGGGRSYRDDLRPVEISQPEGPSFQLDGRELRWQRWRLHVGFSNREGLVLNEIGYEDEGRLRAVCHRASIAELVIPYGDPNPTMHFKNVFDVGEYGLGPLVNQLERGCDCLGEIRYLDAAHVDSRGRPVLLRNAICIHEEDTGLLWKHSDDATGHVDLARARRLVISCIATVGNYEYGYYWSLHQDGEIRFEGKLTGIIHTAGVEPGSPQRHATEVAPGVAAGFHQHFFTARLDLDVDGAPKRRLRGGGGAAAGRPGEPGGERLRRPPPHLRPRVGRDARRLAADRPPLAGREPGPHEPHGDAGRLRAGARRHGVADGAPRVAVPAPGRPPRPPAVGDPVPAGRALPGRRAPKPGGRRRRPAALDGGRPDARERGPGALVHVRVTPRAAARGLAGDAGRQLRLRPAPGRLLRPEPGARRAAPGGALRTGVRSRRCTCPSPSETPPSRPATRSTRPIPATS